MSTGKNERVVRMERKTSPAVASAAMSAHAGSSAASSHCAAPDSADFSAVAPAAAPVSFVAVAPISSSAPASSAATRNTVQKALVLEAVCSLRNHPTSADVYEAVRERYPNISRATVYRNLNALAARGDVLRVEVPNGADRFDFNNTPHYHALCRMCGRVFDIDMPYQHDLEGKVEDAHGFAIERHHIIFEGICASCAK